MKYLTLIILVVVGGLASFAGADTTYQNFYAASVVDYLSGAGNDFYSDSGRALGGPRGGGATSGSTDVVTLGEQGALTLGFDEGLAIANGPGADFIVFENPFEVDSPDDVYAELVRVQVSSDGVNFVEFPTQCGVSGPLGPTGTMNPGLVSGFAGVNPVLAHVDNEPTIDPFDPAQAGGDAFDLADLALHPDVVGGLVDLNSIRYVKLIDVLGDGTETDSEGNAIYDPAGSMEMGPPFGPMVLPVSADIDALAVIHGVPEPACAVVLLVVGLPALLRRGGK